jgi:hypothetical protein
VRVDAGEVRGCWAGRLSVERGDCQLSGAIVGRPWFGARDLAHAVSTLRSRSRSPQVRTTRAAVRALDRRRARMVEPKGERTWWHLLSAHRPHIADDLAGALLRARSQLWVPRDQRRFDELCDAAPGCRDGSVYAYSALWPSTWLDS